MNDKYICDDRNQLENVQKIRNMSDEEFEQFIEAQKANQEK